MDKKHGGYLRNGDSYLLFMLFYKYNHSWDILYLDYFGLSLNAILIAYVIMKTPYYELFVCCMTFACVSVSLITLVRSCMVSSSKFLVIGVVELYIVKYR